MAIKLVVDEKRALDLGRQPRLAVGPALHGQLCLVPGIDGAGNNTFTFDIGETPLDLPEHIKTDSFKDKKGVLETHDQAKVGLV